MNPIRKLCNWYFSRGTLPYWCILAMDCAAVFFSGLAIYYLKYGGLSLAQHFWQLILGLAICLMAYVVAFFSFHTFRGVMRYSSFVDLSRIAYSNIAAGVFVCLVHQVEAKCGHSAFYMTPRFEAAIFIYALATMIMWGLRVIVKTLHDTYRGDDSVQKVFIYGCMQGGIALAKSIRNQNPLRFRLRGFISGDKSLDGSWLLGEQVHYDEDSVVELMLKQKVTTLLVSPLQTENFTHRTTLIEALIAANIKIMMMPQSEEWDGHSDLSHHQLREVEIEDLLPREKIEVDLVAIGQMLRGKRILITGAAGSIGSEMARQVAKFQPAELVLVDQAETPMHDVRLYMANNHKDLKCLTIVSSITDQEHMEKIFSEHKPEYVFHAAAYKHVPMMEDNPGQAVRNNIYGTRVIADLSVKYGTKKFVMISTDKAVNPTNVMGATKRVCEMIVQAHSLTATKTTFSATRFGNVLGSAGSVIPLFKRQIAKGGPVTITDKRIIRYFMTIPEASQLVLESGAMAKNGELFVLNMGRPVKIYDLAENMIRLSGLEPGRDIEIREVGLRPGEKLYEELLIQGENLTKTKNDLIFVEKDTPLSMDELNDKLRILRKAIDTGTDEDIKDVLHQVVPTYHPDKAQIA